MPNQIRSSIQCGKAVTITCHRDCTFVDNDKLGRIQSCIANCLSRLPVLISELQPYIPSLSMNILCSSNDIQKEIGPCFTLLLLSEQEYETIHSLLRISSALLSSLNDIQNDLSECLQLHKPSSNRMVKTTLYNLRWLHELILQKRLDAESALFCKLDAYPRKAEASLRSLMKLEKSPNMKLPYISSRDFETLGVGRWVDDEIINYFVTKWCSKSGTTLGLSTFFGCKFLFEESSCIRAKSVEDLMSKDKSGVQKWCLAASKAQGVPKWDCVFIPINENNSHWFCACINFRLKRIDIYDSLRESCLKNREKPVELRKNTNTMLVLMWLTELLGGMRSEEVLLKDNPFTPWRFDPHAKVPFQPNSFDCGIHTLWHLQHIIEFGFVREDCELSRLKFSDDMTSKRLRLAQEMLDDCKR